MVGWVTIIGIGVKRPMIPAEAVAFTVVTVDPKRRISVVFTFRETVALTTGCV
jgi:hypothetical protein